MAHTTAHTTNEQPVSIKSVSNYWRILLLAAICSAVYFPVLNNGFIADDYPYLDWAARLKTNLWFLFTIPPNNFRMTSFLVFEALKEIAGYRAEAFYVFSIFLHFTNCVLLWTLISRLWGNVRIAYLAAVLFAVVQAPQEAILWLAAMGEPLVAFCLLTAMLLWLKDRYVLSALMFGLGLFSKESAVMLLLLLPLIQWQRGKPLFPKRYFLFLIPAAVFAGVFLWTWSKNSYIQGGVYDAGPHAVLVFVKTFNRLLWPWFYALLVAFRIDTGRWPNWRRALPYLPWIGAAMAPYLFITYQNALPSRHVYLVSMVLAAGMSYLICNLRRKRLQQTFLVAFLAFNIGYLWVRKDAQFEGRARPTSELLRLLRSHSPTPVMIYDFPFTEALVARDVTLLAAGWRPDLIEVHLTTETCSNCINLRWDAKSGTYIGPW